MLPNMALLVCLLCLPATFARRVGLSPHLLPVPEQQTREFPGPSDPPMRMDVIFPGRGEPSTAANPLVAEDDVQNRRVLFSEDSSSADALQCAPMTVLEGPGTVDGSELFGVGRPEGYNVYANNITCQWLIKPFAAGETGDIKLIFTFLHVEDATDYIKIYEADELGQIGNQLHSYTGEYFTPFGVGVSGVSALIVEFTSDPTLHMDNPTLQIGFNATYFDDTEPYTCYQDCNAGTCNEDNSCTCLSNETYEVRGAGCTVDIRKITDSGESLPIDDLCIGCWRYFQFHNPHTYNHVLFELMDRGEADSDPLLAFHTAPPTLTQLTYYDWIDWFYDRSDLHYLAIYIYSTGTYYLGVTNDRLRSTEPLFADLTTRWDPDGWPCLLDCSGNGQCQSHTWYGHCNCDDGWASAYEDSWGTCEYEVNPLRWDHTYHDTVRIGDWLYFNFTISDDQAYKRTFMVELDGTASPHAQPILLVRKGELPRLHANYIPTLPAFVYDWSDSTGFELLGGTRQTIVINQGNLSAGEYYIGVYNIWGYTGVEEESHDEAEIKLYANLYAAGIPCRRFDQQFCAGFSCDFNVGVCDCPEDRLGVDCGEIATELTEGYVFTGTLAIEEVSYYVFDVTQQHIDDGMNVIITLTKPYDQEAYPELLTREGDIPYAYDYSLHDDHDLTATFYHQDTHTILLDNQELYPGTWYVAVINSEGSKEDLTYELTIVFTDYVDCPIGEGNMTCSGVGECDTSLGRCYCDDLNTLDDCSADGVFHLYSGDVAGEGDLVHMAPDIPVDDWVFYSVNVGCENAELHITFETSETDAAPLLVVRKHILPLMLESDLDYFDYYFGIYDHGRRQGILVRGCWEDGACVVHQGSYQTIWDVGFPSPGVYFIGIYNDFELAKKPITDYTLSVSVGACEDNCTTGFIGDNCQIGCPGMIPTGEYSNAPVAEGKSCNEHGTCGFKDEEAHCTCDEFYFGDDCSTACIFTDEATLEVCSGHGECMHDSIMETTFCQCEQAHDGDFCELECPGIITDELTNVDVACSNHGTCRSGNNGLYCSCDNGYITSDCSEACPGVDTGLGGCSGQGDCVMVAVSSNTSSSPDASPECRCKEGFLGDACEFMCIGMSNDPHDHAALPCYGNGTCVLEGDETRCICFAGFTGDDCLTPSASSSAMTAPTHDSVTNTVIEYETDTVIEEDMMLIIIFSATCLGLALLGLFLYWRIQKAKREQARLYSLLQQYRAPLYEDDADADAGDVLSRLDDVSASSGTALPMSSMHADADTLREGL